MKWYYLLVGIGLVAVGTVAFQIVDYRAQILQPEEVSDISLKTGSAKEFVPHEKAAVPAYETSTPAGLPALYPDSPRPGPSTHIVRFTDDGFLPFEVHVKRGDTVTFVNESPLLKTQPATDPNPGRTGYPEPGTCGPTAFDACSPLASGDSWSFMFTIKGWWPYHDHANPIFGGTVVVE
jgi:plastocyanin